LLFYYIYRTINFESLLSAYIIQMIWRFIWFAFAEIAFILV